MAYVVKGLEYMGRPVKNRKIKAGKGPEAKRFVTLSESNTLPTKDEMIALARKNPRVKSVWCMKMEGNKWSKAIPTVKL